MKKLYLLWFFLAVAAGSAHSQSYPPPSSHPNTTSVAVSPVPPASYPPPLSDPNQEARDAVSQLNTSRLTTGVFMNRVMTLTRPQRFGGQGDTATDWKGWEQQY